MGHGLVQRGTDLLCVADLDGNLLKFNKRFQETLGYSSAELQGISFFALVHKKDLEFTRAAFSKLAAKIPVNGFVNRYRCKDRKNS